MAQDDDSSPAPLVPNAVASPDVSSQEQTSGLANQWRQWMQDPHNRAAMIQFGVSLSQPITAGQNALGHIGAAFGEAGEASDRVQAEIDKQQELQSKQELRTAQALRAGDRASYEGQLLNIRQQNAETSRQALQMRGQIAGLNAYVRMQNDYKNKYLPAMEKAKLFADPKNPPHVQTWEEYYAENSRLDPLLRNVTAGGQVTAAGGSNLVDPVSGMRRVPVQNPDDVRKLQSGTPYITPDGRTGTAP